MWQGTPSQKAVFELTGDSRVIEYPSWKGPTLGPSPGSQRIIPSKKSKHKSVWMDPAPTATRPHLLLSELQLFLQGVHLLCPLHGTSSLVAVLHQLEKNTGEGEDGGGSAHAASASAPLRLAKIPLLLAASDRRPRAGLQDFLPRTSPGEAAGSL